MQRDTYRRALTRDDPVAGALSALLEVRRVSHRVRALRAQAWVPLVGFGTIVLGGVGVVGAEPPRGLHVHCGRVLAPSTVSARCAVTGGTASQVAWSAGRLSPHALTLTGEVPLALSLGDHWWYWGAAIGVALALLGALRVLARPYAPLALRWYAVALLSALVSEQAALHAGWTTPSAGVFAAGSGLVVLAAGDRCRIMLGAGGALLGASALVRVLPAVSSSLALPTTLPPASASQLALGVGLVATAIVTWWRSAPRARWRIAHHDLANRAGSV